MLKTKTKNIIIIILILIMIISFWIISLKTNLKNGFSYSISDGLSLEELQEEINIIISKSPLTKNPTQPTTNNQQSTTTLEDNLSKIVEEITEEITNSLKTETTTPANINQF